MKSFATSATGAVAGVMTSNRGSGQPARMPPSSSGSGYQSNLSAPDTYLEDDDSDDDIGKLKTVDEPKKENKSGKRTLDYDDDEKDEEMIGIKGSSELIDLGNEPKVASTIPKLSGPK